MDWVNILRTVLAALMAISLLLLWDNPRMIPWFAAYTALGLTKLAMFKIFSGTEWYAPLDSVVLAVLILATREAFNWLTLDLEPKSERRALLSGLIGFGCGCGFVFARFAETDGMGVFSTVRDSIHAGLFGFMLIAILYASLAKPFPVERFALWHNLLLTGWLGAHAISRPLGGYEQIPTALLFTPAAILLFICWNIAISRRVHIRRPRFVFGTPPDRSAFGGGRGVSSQHRHAIRHG